MSSNAQLATRCWWCCQVYVEQRFSQLNQIPGKKNVHHKEDSKRKLSSSISIRESAASFAETMSSSIAWDVEASSKPPLSLSSAVTLFLACFMGFYSLLLLNHYICSVKLIVMVQTYTFNTSTIQSAGHAYSFRLFLGWKKILKKREIIYHSVDKRFPKFWIFFGSTITVVLGHIIWKFYQHPKTKKIRLHPSYTINHSIVKGFLNFWGQKFDLIYIFILIMLLYTTRDYYGIIKGQMVFFLAEYFIFEQKSPFN